MVILMVACLPWRPYFLLRLSTTPRAAADIASSPIAPGSGTDTTSKLKVGSGWLCPPVKMIIPSVSLVAMRYNDVLELLAAVAVTMSFRNGDVESRLYVRLTYPTAPMENELEPSRESLPAHVERPASEVA